MLRETTWNVRVQGEESAVKTRRERKARRRRALGAQLGQMLPRGQFGRGQRVSWGLLVLFS